jgi:hypothetical protein
VRVEHKSACGSVELRDSTLNYGKKQYTEINHYPSGSSKTDGKTERQIRLSKLFVEIVLNLMFASS